MRESKRYLPCVAGSGWNYGELEAYEVGSDNRYTLTQKSKVTESDSYSIYKTIAVPHSGKEDYLNVYEVNWLGYADPGTTMHTVYTDEETMTGFFTKKAANILRKDLRIEDFDEWFSMKQKGEKDG